MEFVGFLIFIAVGIIALMAKVQEQKAQDTERQQRPARHISPEDLPERTRRMLYGGTEIPEARPKHEGGFSIELRTETTTPPLQPREARPATRQATPATRQAMPVPTRAAPPRRRVVVAGPPPAPKASQTSEHDGPQVRPEQVIEASKKIAAHAQAHQQPQQQRRPAQQSAAAVRAGSLAAARQRLAAAAQEFAAQGAPAPRQAGAPAESSPRQTGIAELLKSGHAVRRGIIISEILGKPLALRS